MTDFTPVPPLELSREETKREDGRYLIYYTFTGADQTAGDVAPALQPDRSTQAWKPVLPEETPPCPS